MINQEILTEKLKYLIMTESGKRFEIFKLHVELEFEDYEKREKISEYTVDIEFDYNGRIDERPADMANDIIYMMNLMEGIVGNYIITPEGKIRQDYDAFVEEGIIWSIDYVFDEKHIFNTSFKVIYK